jgi:hypothetical protein
MKAYHLHTPKTGGIFLKNKLIRPLEIYCGLETISNSLHEAWSLVEHDTYVISSFREPIKRIVSHYCHFMEANENALPTLDDFRKWYENNKTYISNYQSKNFLVTADLSVPRRTLISESIFIDVELDKIKLFENLRRTNLLIRDNQFSDAHLDQVKLKIIQDCNLVNTFHIKDIPSNYNSRKTSADLFAQLSQSDIDSIKEDNELDYKVYLDNSLYWNNGQ